MSEPTWEELARKAGMPEDRIIWLKNELKSIGTCCSSASAEVREMGKLKGQALVDAIDSLSKRRRN